MAQRIRLTDKRLREMAPGSRDLFFYDLDIPAFGAIVRPAGTVQLFVRVPHPIYKTQRIRLGTLDNMRVDDARARALEELQRAAHGVEPIRKAAQRAGALLWGEAVDKFHAARETHISEPHRIQQKKYLDNGEIPKSIRLPDIRRADHIDPAHKRLLESAGVATANAWLAAVKAFFRWAIDTGQWHGKSPAHGIRKYKGEKPRLRILDRAELARLNAALATEPAHIRLAVALMLDAGMRPGEALGLRWEAVDVANNRATVKAKGSGDPEPVLLPTALAAELGRHASASPSDYVVPGRTPDSPRLDKFRRPWERLCRKAEIEGAHPHDLRRTFGSRIALRFGIFQASKLLRHSDPRITQRVYAHLLPDDAIEALDACAVLTGVADKAD